MVTLCGATGVYICKINWARDGATTKNAEDEWKNLLDRSQMAKSVLNALGHVRTTPKPSKKENLKQKKSNWKMGLSKRTKNYRVSKLMTS